MNKHILFVHIPKTAGTSFRIAGREYFSKKNTFLDYGKNSGETSEVILDFFYEKDDLYQLSKALHNRERSFLSGHFHVSKYMHIYDAQNTITFVREPIEQVLSHYKHHVRDLNYQDTIETFIKEKRFKNIQSRMLGAKPLALYGFIGLTEEYAKSIELINDHCGTSFQVYTANTSASLGSAEIELDEETIALIKKENKLDIEMYEKAKLIFANRRKKFEEKKRYVNIVIEEQTDKSVRGYAYTKDTNEPVKIDIYSNNKIIDTIQAKIFKGGLLRHNIPRKGFVGFEYVSENTISWKIRD